MNDNMTATLEQKKDLTIEALEIAGFTEKENFQGLYTKKHGLKTIVVNLNGYPTKPYFNVDGKKITEDDEYDTLVKVSKMITEAEDGRTPTISEPREVVYTAPHEGIPEQPGSVFVPVVPEPPQVTIPTAPSDLSVSTIKKYINDKATDEEAYVFLQLCKARGLNPFLKEAYLIKYDHVQPATMVVGKDAFMKRAELNIQFDGIQAGIIVDCGDDTTMKKFDEERKGTVLLDGDTLIGGWAKVYRKDHKYPTEITVSMKEFNTGKSSWKKMPATMIRKVALVQALREAFPSELSGMYDQSEMGVEVIV